jgi:hypothetical protein
MAESSSNPSSQVHAGVETLRAAALTLISAARGFLDVAEAMVADPNASREVTESVTRVMKGMADLVVRPTPSPGPAHPEPVVEEIPVRAKPKSRPKRPTA